MYPQGHSSLTEKIYMEQRDCNRVIQQQPIYRIDTEVSVKFRICKRRQEYVWMGGGAAA